MCAHCGSSGRRTGTSPPASTLVTVSTRITHSSAGMLASSFWTIRTGDERISARGMMFTRPFDFKGREPIRMQDRQQHGIGDVIRLGAAEVDLRADTAVGEEALVRRAADALEDRRQFDGRQTRGHVRAEHEERLRLLRLLLRRLLRLLRLLRRLCSQAVLRPAGLCRRGATASTDSAMRINRWRCMEGSLWNVMAGNTKRPRASR